MSTLDKIIDALSPKKAMTAMISYRTTPEIKAFLKKYAKDQGITMQMLITDALVVYLKQKRSELREEIHENK